MKSPTLPPLVVRLCCLLFALSTGLAGPAACLSKDTEPSSAATETGTAVLATNVAPSSTNQPLVTLPNDLYASTDGIALVSGNIANNLCLAAANGSLFAGNAVGVARCDGSLPQQWRMQGGRYSLGDSLCLTAGDIGVPVKLAPCASDDNQRFINQKGAMVSIAYMSLYGFTGYLVVERSASSGGYQVVHRPIDSNRDPNLWCVAISATPRERGFVIRPDSDPLVCLQRTTTGVQAAPCTNSDANQRWVFEYGLLSSVADFDTIVATPLSTGPSFTLKSRASSSVPDDGFWFGEGGDLPGLKIPQNSPMYYNLYYDTGAKTVSYTSSKTQTFWQLGGTGTP